MSEESDRKREKPITISIGRVFIPTGEDTRTMVIIGVGTGDRFTTQIITFGPNNELIVNGFAGTWLIKDIREFTGRVIKAEEFIEAFKKAHPRFSSDSEILGLLRVSLDAAPRTVNC